MGILFAIDANIIYLIKKIELNSNPFDTTIFSHNLKLLNTSNNLKMMVLISRFMCISGNF